MRIRQPTNAFTLEVPYSIMKDGPTTISHGTYGVPGIRKIAHDLLQR